MPFIEFPAAHCLHLNGFSSIFAQVNYCSEACKASDFDWFHWAECGLMDCLQDESVGRLALLVYRLMVKSGLEKCIDTHDADLALTEKNCCYDSLDYASVYLQVIYVCLKRIKRCQSVICQGCT